MAYFHSPRIITDGLTLILDAANHKSYSGSGTEWKDLSGNGINGELNGGPTFSTEGGGSFEMGNGKWINLGNTLYLSNNSPLTVFGWMKVNSFSSRDMLLCRNDAIRSGSPYTWLFGIRDNGVRMSAYDGSSWRDINFSFLTSTWYNLIFSYDGTTMSYYVNGLLIGTQPYTFSDSTTGRNVQVGGYSGTTGDIVGSYGLVKFYNRGLNSDEVLQNYNATKGRYGL